MTKRLFILVLLAFSALNLDAQIIKASFGIKGTGAGTVISTSKDATNSVSIGGGGGAFLGLKVADFLGLQAEALYTKQAANYNFEEFSDISSYQATQTYILIPAVAQLWLGRSVALEFGIQKAIGRKEDIKAGTQFPKDAIGMQDYNSYIAGINFNLGKVGVLDLRYLSGIAGTYSEQAPEATHGFQVSLGLRLFSSKKHLFR